MELLVAALLFVVLLLAGEARGARAGEQLLSRSGLAPSGRARSVASDRSIRAMLTARPTLLGPIIGVPAAYVGLQLAGPLGLLAGTVGGVAIPVVVCRRRARRKSELIERQFAELTEATSLAVRSGLSVGQAVEFAADESVEPLRGPAAEVIARQRLGVSFEDALAEFGKRLGTDDARLFVLILTVHARAGGNLAGALDQVTATIRHRMAVRNELRALSAQGRISGAILASLPLAFSLVIAVTSRDQLAPVYRSAMGIAMVSVGLAMELLAFLWIRRLLRIET